jgi:hypothetical protein
VNARLFINDLVLICYRIVDGSHDNAVLVRTATISQKHKIMTLTFFPNIARQTVVISITAEINGVNTESVFNITADTKKVQIVPAIDIINVFRVQRLNLKMIKM